MKITITRQVKLAIIIGLSSMLLVVLVALVSGCIEQHDCKSDNAKFVKVGVLKSIENYVSFNMMIFEDDSILKLHGSSNAEYSLMAMYDMLIPGINYTFSYHHECVMSDGNEPYWFEGNVIDRIEKVVVR